MKKSLIFLTMILFSVILWARGGVDAEAEALDIATVTEGKYVWFSDEEWENNSDKNRVLFFHAAWCPTCRQAQKEIIETYAQLDDNTVIFKIDYDNSKELKRKYGVTKQHTFVIADGNSEALAKWYGGSTLEINDQLNKL